MSDVVRVLHVLDSLAPGGLENGVVNVARRLHGGGFDIHAACLRFRGDFAGRMPEPEKVVVLGKTDGFSLRAVWKLNRLIRSTRADLVHTHNLGTLIYGVLATLGGIVCPIVHGEHGQIQKQDLAPKRLAQRRRLFRLCKRVHVVAAGMVQNLAALGLDNVPITVTPNGVDSDRFSPPASKAAAKEAAGFSGDDVIVGIVGRLVALKRHRLLFDAFALLGTELPCLHLLVVGDGGAEKEDIVRQMREHPLAARIRWAGHQDDMKPFYQAMDVLAAPSEIEGLSNAVLEGMACGTPVLAHAACGNADVIEHDRSGFLAHIYTPAQLAAELRRVLADENLLHDCGIAARDTVCGRFSMDAMAGCYRALYHGAVSGRK
ncbi:MAG: glycosyltransferase [Verrucomicrobiaceae bacterium]|nr:glycosyltransferase [Verrucomicrobiaceae bacterium]